MSGRTGCSPVPPCDQQGAESAALLNANVTLQLANANVAARDLTEAVVYTLEPPFGLSRNLQSRVTKSRNFLLPSWEMIFPPSSALPPPRLGTRGARRADRLEAEELAHVS